ncbi:MAG: PQQ-binding-like beta-propeller repeat protein [Planctomycetota bacterium]|nr:PQQ-binding-like beta-propeller repeat protein [Planctomycetota bacterium]
MSPASLILFCAASSSFAADWPTFRGDSSRGGYSPDELPAELSLLWVSKSRHVPRPAWTDKRMSFDRAFQPIVAGGMLYYASSADCKLYALDAATGEERWTFFSDGPVRFAPLAWKGRIFFVSDDSYLYCLNAEEGSLLWKVRGGPEDSLLLGNDRMISRWPARGGPVIADDTLYFSAGIWPSEGIFLHAVDPESGRFLWMNDTAGWMYMGQPHGGANALSGVSIQGDLAVAGDVLLAPNGRAVPAGFRRSDGKFLYFHLQKNTKRGGAEIVAADTVFFNGGGIFRPDTGQYVGKSAPASLVAVTPEKIFSIKDQTGKAAGTYLFSIERQKVWKESVSSDRKGNQVTKRALNAPVIGPKLPHAATRFIVAGNSLVLGNEGKVSVVDSTSGESVSSVSIEGNPVAMAVADSRLYVSNELGTIYCFGGGDGQTRVYEATATMADSGEDAPGQPDDFSRATDEIIRRSEVTEGYCLDFDCGEGDLTLELARKTKLQIYAVDSNPESVKRARRKLDDAGLYGERVTIVLSKSGHAPFPNYFADLVVSGRSVTGKNATSFRSEEMARMLKPYGGVALIGPPGKMLEKRRGPLAGAGEWTHQYSGPGNTTCSKDAIVRGPLGLLWFSDLSLGMPNRHGRAPAPLFFKGRMFIEGMDGIKCVDAYNGRFLWEIPLPGILKSLDQDHLMGTAGTGSNICVAEEGLFVATKGKCLKIDQATGKVLAEYHAPGAGGEEENRWGIVACTGGILFGTTANTEHLVQWRFRKSDMKGMFTESNTLFALDAGTGKLKWRYEAKYSLRHNAIAFDGKRVFLIDQPLAAGDLWEQIKEAEKRRGKSEPDQPKVVEAETKPKDPFEEKLKKETEEKQLPPQPPPPPIPFLLALDASTGKTVWKDTEKIQGTVLEVSKEHDVLLVSYQKTRYRLASETGSQMFACRASTGKRLWTFDSRKIRSRPMINDRTIYAEPGTWDLLTGEKRDFQFARSYGCGIAASSKHLMVFRSATLGYTDLTGSFGTENYGGLRPGCWINAIPAGGLVLVPDYTARCSCSYPIKASIALQPRGIRPPLFEPNGKISARPLEVGLASGSLKQKVHYTDDGSLPDRNSPQWTGKIEIKKTTTIRARSYMGGQPTAVSEVTFIIDPDMIPLVGPDWRTQDAGKGKSNWQMKGNYLTELSNLCVGNARDPNPAMERPGSLRVHSADAGNGEMLLQIASSDDDVLGVAFRIQADDRFYLWAMDLQRGFHVLALKDGKTYKVLASNKKRYQRNKWYDLKVSLNGPDIKVFLDDQLDLAATDSTLSSGKIALYSWGCAGSKFRRLRWKKSNQEP